MALPAVGMSVFERIPIYTKVDSETGYQIASVPTLPSQGVAARWLQHRGQ